MEPQSVSMSTSTDSCNCCAGFCNFLKRVCCIGSRTASTESYYRELGDQDTLKFEGSLLSDDSVEIDIEIEAQRARLFHHANEGEDSSGTRDQASTSSGRPFSSDTISTPERPVEVESALPAEAEPAGPDEVAPEEPDEVAPAGPDEVEPVMPAEVAHSVEETSAVLVDPTADKNDAEKATGARHKSRDMFRSRCTERFQSLHKRRKRHLLTRSLVEQEALLDDLLIGQVQCVLDQSSLWRFNAFTLDNVAGGRGLPLFCVHLFEVYGLVAHFRLDLAKVWKLFNLFQENYHSSNPYHNCVHAIDVTQAMSCFLREKQIMEHLEPIEVMAGVLAAVAHDLDHPGVNQSFLVATNNHLAELYDSKSVLESHHWRIAVSCLIESQILSDIPEYQAALEEMIKALILATDITRQQDYLGQFKTYLDTNQLNMTRADHRLLVLQMALKCADISNPCRPWDISQHWSLRVCEEFFLQGDIERHLDLELSPLCDRYTTSVPKIQSGFFRYVVTPLITVWHAFLKSDLSEEMLRNLIKNHKKWDLFAIEDQKEAQKLYPASDDLGVDEQLTKSSEMLLPPRRCSLNPLEATSTFREQLRRLSAPLNIFQDSRAKTQNLHEQNVASQTGLKTTSLGRERLRDVPITMKIEKLIPETSIISMTSMFQARRIRHVLNEFRDDKQWEQVEPLVYTNVRAQSLIPRASTHEECLPRAVKSDSSIRFGLSSPEGPRRPESKTGSRLFENLKAWHHDFTRRRNKAIPAEVLPSDNSAERRLRELREVLPQLIARTLSPRDRSGRRGSAPVGETRSVSSTPRRGSELGLRVQRAYQFPTRTEQLPLMPRRSSLPVEVITGISSH